ncbi:DNA polymerase III subunit gamma/tau, partial [candidate division WOR-3 bacterium]|nr:DNA polymerase III subunit gamma/tau [candidate division WOR-3 bacterium]
MNVGYLILARKLRPANFDDLIGQKHVVETLKNALDKGKIAQAYLFSGPRGIGKTTAARILSKSINCEQGVSSKPCNKCTTCRAISESRFQDVVEIDGASNRGVDDIRSIRENLLYTPMSRERIYIIDEVHMLTKEAFNALLKTLEEPPANTRFIFATTEPEKVPQTIISRCQRFDFKLVDARTIFNYLKTVCENENIDISDRALEVIVRKAQGSVRDSLSLLDQLSVYREIDEKKAREVLGEVDFSEIEKIITAISENDPKAAMIACDKIIEEGYQPTDIAHSVAIALFESLKKDSPLQSISSKLGIDRTLRTLELLSNFLNRNSKLSPVVSLEILFARISRMVDTKDIKDLIFGIENSRIENKNENSKPRHDAQKIKSHDKDESFQNFLSNVGSDSKVIYHYLTNSSAEVSGDTLIIQLPNSG